MASGQIILDGAQCHIADRLVRFGNRRSILLIGEMDLIALRIGNQIQQPARNQVRTDAGLIIVLQRIGGTAKLFHHPIRSPDAETGRLGRLSGKLLGPT